MVRLSFVLVTAAWYIYVMSPQIPVIETADEGLVLMGIYLSKALTCLIYFLYKYKLLTDTFGNIVV